ncbi:hypothetical protein LCGC14_3057100 [marine sediment metagenome]|uniref:Uncharacterized protein n=1 Tax=marine sediment metagenome TaxID=412755 RepID=A0A0F8ZAS3_9ZZZZ
MKITKGQHLHVDHERKGKFLGIATRDFDTENEEFYPIASAQGEPIEDRAVGYEWLKGEEVPCRKSLCSISLCQ